MRLEQVTFTRFLAAISIVIFHFGQNISPFKSDSISFIITQADIGVSYFFVLSGFIMIIAYKNKDEIRFGNYIKRRFARIYPVYGLALLVFFIYHLVFNKQIDFKGLISNIALVQSWIPKYALSFNYPGWSLSTEVLFYLSFPFLFNYFYKKYTLKKIFITIICFFILSQLIAHIFKYSSFYDEYLPESHNFIFYFPLMHLNQFLVGNIAGLFFLKFIKKKNYDFWIIVLVLMIPVLLKLNTGAIYNNGILACVFVPLIILISANNGFLTRISSMKLPVFFR
jgi:peptidoglycan/LPS O-acetylase OafA/YrhL